MSIAAQELLRTHGLTLFKGLAVVGVSGALISKFIMTTAEAEAPASSDIKETRKIFGRAGPVFTSLALQSSEDVNHNTKRLLFKLPDEAAVSGLPLTCKLLCTPTPVLTT